MNSRLEQVHDVVETAQKHGKSIHFIKQHLPEPETSEDVTAARCLNFLFDYIEEDEEDLEFMRRLHHLRKEAEKQAIDDVKSRVEVDVTDSRFNKNYTAIDPISGIRFRQSVSPEMKKVKDPKESATHWLVREVVKP